MKISDIILNEQSLDEGFWDDIKAAYKSGKEDYIKRKAAELGMTPGNIVATANKKTGGKVAGQTSNTPNAIRKRNSRAAAQGGAPAPALAAPAPAPAAPAPSAPKPRVRVPAGSAPAQGGAPAPAAKGRKPAAQGGAPAPAAPAPAPAAKGRKPAAPAPAQGGKPAAPAQGGKPAAPAPAQGGKPAAPAQGGAPVTFDAVKQSVAGLSKKEKQKLLTNLLSDLGTPVR